MEEFSDVIVFVVIAAIILVAMKLVGKTLKIILWVVLIFFAMMLIIGPEQILSFIGL